MHNNEAPPFIRRRQERIKKAAARRQAARHIRRVPTTQQDDMKKFSLLPIQDRNNIAYWRQKVPHRSSQTSILFKTVQDSGLQAVPKKIIEALTEDDWREHYQTIGSLLFYAIAKNGAEFITPTAWNLIDKEMALRVHFMGKNLARVMYEKECLNRLPLRTLRSFTAAELSQQITQRIRAAQKGTRQDLLLKNDVLFSLRLWAGRFLELQDFWAALHPDFKTEELQKKYKKLSGWVLLQQSRPSRTPNID